MDDELAMVLDYEPEEFEDEEEENASIPPPPPPSEPPTPNPPSTADSTAPPLPPEPKSASSPLKKQILVYKSATMESNGTMKNGTLSLNQEKIVFFHPGSSSQGS